MVAFTHGVISTYRNSLRFVYLNIFLKGSIYTHFKQLKTLNG